jgi:hypothetical protein
VLCIIRDDKRKSEYEWHIGRPKPFVGLVTALQADGDELEHIRDIFPALTPRNRIVCNWRGDIAQMIYDNLL